jgi:D-sedoheptulose 7-phosphate isomerase
MEAISRADRSAAEHLRNIVECLEKLSADAQRAADWGSRLAAVFANGGKLLVVGNGGSSAEAQHLSAEFVGRYSVDRPAYPAINLSAETSLLTAILNDYGPEAVFARQVQAHARAGDVLLCLSTSGESPNIVAAARAARELGAAVWAMTGRGTNTVGPIADEWIAVDSAVVATVQEAHLVLLHIICESFDETVAPPGTYPAAGRGDPDFESAFAYRARDRPSSSSAKDANDSTT